MGAPSPPLTPPAREQDVWTALARLHDPEIPVISLVDLGVIHSVELDGERACVRLLPTFIGCPALEQMRKDAAGALSELGFTPTVEIERQEQWSSDRISEHGRRVLRESGFAPPTGQAPTLIALQGPAECPYCNSTDTRLENLFGPTPCRSLRYCNSCRQPFEQFKTL